jgi:RNA polymerase sigma factor (TIGR02999 family)
MAGRAVRRNPGRRPVPYRLAGLNCFIRLGNEDGMHDQADQDEVTQLLAAVKGGHAAAMGRVVTLVYAELERIAHRQLAREQDARTLETGALVHEAYLKLSRLDHIEWQSCEHFLAMAARLMRRILIDYAEARHAQKRGGGDVRITLDSGFPDAAEEHVDDILALDDALRRLARLSERQSRIVECRFFAGMSVEETAAALELSPATVKRDWVAARAWLNRELSA